MKRGPLDVTDAELAILQVLWERGTATRREITDALYPGGDAAHYATVQKLLERLEAKECVRVDRGGAVLSFTPALSREELISRRLLDVRGLFGGQEPEGGRLRLDTSDRWGGARSGDRSRRTRRMSQRRYDDLSD